MYIYIYNTYICAYFSMSRYVTYTKLKYNTSLICNYVFFYLKVLYDAKLKVS